MDGGAGSSGSTDAFADSGLSADPSRSADATSGTGSEGSATSGSSSGGGTSTTASSSGTTSTGATSTSAAGGRLPAGQTAFPAPEGKGVCPDPPLRITFSAPPSLGSTGKVQVYDAAQTGSPVAVVDMAATSFTDTIGGTTFNTVRPAYVDGNDAVITLNSNALTYGKTYYVTVDAGAIVGPGGASFSVTGATTWRFSTAAEAPSNATSLRVALDGSGDFCSVQGALDAAPVNNSAASTVTIANGVYHEIVHFASKNNITLSGQSRTGTVIEGTNNNNLNPTTSTRSLVGIDNSSGIVIDTLTIDNLTPLGGSQAEALRVESCDECIVRDANIISYQDTLLWSGRVYADNCTIEGNVDFVWGSGAAYFNECTLWTIGSAGAIVQARNSPSGYGYVFVNSTLMADPGITGQVLGRTDVSQYPASQVAYINCTMGAFIAPAGWTITGGTPSQLRFSEYQSVDPSGNPIDVSQRAAGSTQLSAAEAASMRDPTVVLSGWQP